MNTRTSVSIIRNFVFVKNPHHAFNLYNVMGMFHEISDYPSPGKLTVFTTHKIITIKNVPDFLDKFANSENFTSKLFPCGYSYVTRSFGQHSGIKFILNFKYLLDCRVDEYDTENNKYGVEFLFKHDKIYVLPCESTDTASDFIDEFADAH